MTVLTLRDVSKFSNVNQLMFHGFLTKIPCIQSSGSMSLSSAEAPAVIFHMLVFFNTPGIQACAKKSYIVVVVVARTTNLAVP